MHIKCNFYLPSKFNGKYVYEGKCPSQCIIYRVNDPCVTLFIQVTLSRLSRKEKPDSFASHFKHHFNTTTSRTDLRKYTKFKVVKQINPIGVIKTFTKPNGNICMQERLTILRRIREKRVTVINRNSEINGACQNKTTFHCFFLSTDYPVFNG